VATSPDYSPVCSPDYSGPSGTSPDSLGPIPIGMGAATDLFCAAKAAEGASPRTLEWYRMIVGRAVRRFGEARPVDAVPAAEVRAWLLELRASLAPESIAGYVRGLKAFGNWCAAEEVAAAGGFRGLRRPKVPHRLIAPFSDPELRSLLALADQRERALALVLLDTGLRLSELVSLRVGDVRPDGTLHVMDKGAKERIVPIGASARRALVRYLATRAAVTAGDPLFCGRWGPALTARGIQQAIARLGRRAEVGTRCSPHTFRHTFARGYLVNGGDVFSLQQILGHATLDMVRRYVFLASFETVRRLHAAASPADGLVIGPKVSLFIPRAWVGDLEDLAETSRVMVQDVIREAIGRFLATLVPDMELTVA
jgi:integrase/recombinase XerC